LNLLDWIIVGLLVVGGVRGLRRGLVKSVMGLAGLIVGLLVASQFYRTLAGYLELHYATVSRMASSLQMHLPLASAVSTSPAGETGILVEAVTGLGLPEFATRYLAAAAESMPGLPDAATVGEAVSTLLASSIVGLLCFVGLFFLTQLVFMLLAWFLSGLISVTPLVMIDRIAGLALGAAYTAVVLTLVIGGLSLLATLPVFAFMGRALEASTIAPHLLSLFQFLLPRVPEWLSLG